MKILGPRLKERLKGRIVWPTDEGDLCMPEISTRSGIPEQTLRTRMATYGCTDARVLSTTHLPHSSGPPPGAKKGQDFRPNCRRDWVLCKRYHDCQSSRLHLTDSPKWIRPQNTDDCYEPDGAAASIPYVSSLSATFRFTESVR